MITSATTVLTTNRKGLIFLVNIIYKLAKNVWLAETGSSDSAYTLSGPLSAYNIFLKIVESDN